VFPSASNWSNARWYEAVQNMPPGTRTLLSAYTPYQKLDVMESPDGGRYLYLDGLQHFGGYDDAQLNVIMGRVPAQFVLPENALVIGAGSMQMAAMIAESAGHVTTVEIDPLVMQASLDYFLAVNHMDTLTNRTVVIDDAKHFLANTSARYNLVAMDTPAAYSAQTATLYSAPFFESIAAHLNPGGVLVANLTSDFTPDDFVSRRVTASLLANFREVMVVTPGSVGWSFAYAGDDLPFDYADIEAALRANGETEYAIFETAAVRAVTGDAPPITLDSMDVVLHVSVHWIQNRLDS
jgi:spermidine synthase